MFALTLLKRTNACDLWVVLCFMWDRHHTCAFPYRLLVLKAAFVQHVKGFSVHEVIY